MTNIDRIDIGDGAYRREFFMLARVRFNSQGEDDYYADDELAGRIEDWVDAALNDRDDSPSLFFHDVPASMKQAVKAVSQGRYPNNSENLAVLNRLAGDVAIYRHVDPERSQGAQDDLMRTALEMIRDGAGDPAALARVALSTQRTPAPSASSLSIADDIYRQVGPPPQPKEEK